MLRRVFRSVYVPLILLGVLYAGWIGYVLYRDKPLDFYVYYLTAHGFSRGVNVYDIGYGADPQVATATWAKLAAETGVTNYTAPYRYPPLMAELMWPFLLLSPGGAAAVWLIATALAFIVAAWLSGRASSLEHGGKPLAIARRTLTLWLLLLFVPALTTLHAGQVNGFALLALALAYHRLQCSPTGVGGGVGVAAMLKTTPVAHMAYLALRRQWKAVAAAGAVIVVLLLASLPFIGPDGFLSYVTHGSGTVLMRELFPSGANQSFNGFFARLLTRTEGHWHLADAPDLARWLWISASLALVAATAAVCWPVGSCPAPTRSLQLGFALVTIVVDLITPFCFYHQFVWLLIPLFALTEEALLVAARRWMLAPLALGYVLTDVHGLLWHSLEFNPLLVSMPFLTALMLWGLLAWLIVRETRS